MSLSDKSIFAAKPAAKPYKLFDGAGLYVEVTPSGGKYWRLKYRIASRERRAALGVYPTVSLKEARDKAIDVKRQLSRGVDPGEQKRIARALKVSPQSDSFGALAAEWLGQRRTTWSASHWTKIDAMLKRDLLPWLEARPIADITPPELLTVLRRIEARGAVDTTKRARIVAGQVFRFGVATGKVLRDPTPDLKGAIAPTVKQHLAAITEPKVAGRLMAAIQHYEGTPVVRAALRLAPLTFVRPGELRAARWAEMDLAAAEWRLPPERMKTRQPHIVPLSRQAVEILSDLHPLTGKSPYVFPSHRSRLRPMSENAILMALRSLGYSKEEMTGHGFRAMARTILDEVLDFRVDLIEHQLAHAVRDANGRAYNRTAHLEGRKKMMQAWSDYLEKIRREFESECADRLHRDAA
jgi:integrase